MSVPTRAARSLREALERDHARVEEVLARYGATRPQLFGSVARGDADVASDIDLLVDLDPVDGNVLLRVAGIREELSGTLGVRVDVVTDALLREPVAQSAHADAVSL